ncbi:MAG: hypothetical protein JWN86_303 [Planctomycetota bacterium]|nr:hypothetical protein [Planctomycetota bacterium]
MWGRRTGHRTPRHLTPAVEGLDTRKLLSAGRVGANLGPYLSPGNMVPRVSSPAVIVDPHHSINTFLAAQIGSGVDTVEQQVAAKGSSKNAQVADVILSNPFIHSVFSRQDTYTLLGSVATTALRATPTPTSAQADSVTYQVPSEATYTIAPGAAMATVQVLPVGSTRGFVLMVPISNIRTFAPADSGKAEVQVPSSLLPADVLRPPTPAVSNGPLTQTYSSAGAVILSAFRSAVPRSGPNAPRSIPGLRLAGAFATNGNFRVANPGGLLNSFRVAVDRNVFALSGTQTNKLNIGLMQFESTVASMSTTGAFTPAVPPAAPKLPKGPLNGTVTVSLGTLRELTNVAATQTGLQIPNLGNFPGRIDVGYVVDRQGNFGISLTVRGPLSGAPKGVASSDVVAGDLQVELSNARNLSDLTGTRNIEGLNQGAGLSGALSASSYNNGTSTFATSAGYGSGFEFGTGTAYTQVIPLGNVYALIPESPKS